MAVDQLAVACWVVEEEALVLQAIVVHGAVIGWHCPIVTLGAVTCLHGSRRT